MNSLLDKISGSEKKKVFSIYQEYSEKNMDKVEASFPEAEDELYSLIEDEEELLDATRLILESVARNEPDNKELNDLFDSYEEPDTLGTVVPTIIIMGKILAGLIALSSIKVSYTNDQGKKTFHISYSTENISENAAGLIKKLLEKANVAVKLKKEEK